MKFLKEQNSRFTPHDGQILAGNFIFSHGKTKLGIECGRKWGKSEFAVDMCWRLGNMIRGGQGYYFGPYAKQVREIVWASGRMPNHGPREYVKAIHKNEMRVTFTSDTFVKCEGADEFKGGKGFNPDFVVLDEYADYSEEFWQAMSPNFASKDAIVVIISSPPWQLESSPGVPVHFVKLMDLWKSYHEAEIKTGVRNKYAYINQPITTNPHIPKEWIEEERKNLIAMGMEDVWEREYMAKRVIGGGRRLIGTFDQERHVYPHAELMERIEKDKSNLIWLDIADPGSKTVFAALFMAINPYNKEVYFLDEIYEQQEDETMVEKLWPRMKEIEDELYPDEDDERFLRVYDEREAWFYVEINNRFGIAFIPTDKANNKLESGFSLLRTIFAYDKGFVSERCKWLAFELLNLRKDKNGQIPTRAKDHLIDTARYGLHAADYFLTEEDKPKAITPHPRMVRRPPSLEEDARDMYESINSLFDDPFRAVEEDSDPWD